MKFTGFELARTLFFHNPHLVRAAYTANGLSALAFVSRSQLQIEISFPESTKYPVSFIGTKSKRTHLAWMLLDGEAKKSAFSVFESFKSDAGKLGFKFTPPNLKDWQLEVSLFSSSRDEFAAFSRDLTLCVKNQQPIPLVLKKHKSLKNKQLRYPQADSAIILLMKMGYGMLAKLSEYQGIISTGIETEIEDALTVVLNTVVEVVQEWPEIVNVSDFKQQTPLMLAAHQKDYEMVEVLLKAKADPNLKDFTGRTALHSAAASRCLKSAQLLLEYGCDDKITMQEGATALHTATRMGELPIVKLLVKKSPNLLLVKDPNGVTPQELARSIAENIGLYEYLKRYLLSENRTVVSHKKYQELSEYFEGKNHS
ncbi:ankyrin repeat domain-containing protein [Marinomonas sp. TI.3.20]|uniref:ankyrin repeat domain-containing protein n=1 Tax=Marinomonas sp. TI.3.20 TaxID=3121296 RepID=UPI00312043F2